MELVLLGAIYALPILWAVGIMARLGENNRLLKRMAEDLSALRGAAERDRSVDP